MVWLGLTPKLVGMTLPSTTYKPSWLLTRCSASTTPAFAWLTDDGTRVYRFEKFIDVARTVMSRREIPLQAAVEDRLRVLHAEATAEVGS